MLDILIVIVIVCVVIYFLNSGDDKNDDKISTCDKIKKGITTLNTKDPLYDYIKARQLYNFQGDITEDDLIELGIENK